MRLESCLTLHVHISRLYEMGKLFTAVLSKPEACSTEFASIIIPVLSVSGGEVYALFISLPTPRL